MVSMPDSMEALKVMTDYLDKAAEQDGAGDRADYFGHAAICSGLMAIVYELRRMRAEIEKKG
ncbi:MAG: hypothetical protein KGJ78_00010 [Alphaproteobacteria bacterium]|nr:hypothetical protein [Alphaproteobacteria bacterium]